ncbi:uncharacterized protein LOC123560657 [Mercenaria mercenaria]|uniref:uncharacterized protein LOC123560657 n=1 Tax=Mercenaria mercenaria TaxID=6596 RepID=UPI00234EAC88|nr:uncharacterized protein LOC123560657 [Mercenaria mercenaria]
MKTTMGYRERYIMSRDSGFSSKYSDYSLGTGKRKASSFSPIDKPMTLPRSTRTLSRKSLYSPKVYHVSPRKNVDILKISRQSTESMNLLPMTPESRHSFDSLDSWRLSPREQVDRLRENLKFPSKFRIYTKPSSRSSELTRSTLSSPKKYISSPSYRRLTLPDSGLPRSQRASTESVLSGSRSPSSSVAGEQKEKEGEQKLLGHEAAASNIDRFNKPLHTTGQTTFGFKGFPDNNMLQPKQPLRHQPSADLTSDVNRYFRKDSPPEWHPPPNQPPPRMPSPPPQPQKEPDWLQEKRNTPPQEALHQTISPRYKDEPQSYRKHPIIRDPHGELTSADKRKKLDEIYIAEEDLAMARQRKEREKLDKIKEQQKIRELQDSYKPWGRPGGGAPNRIREMQEDFNPFGQPGSGAPLGDNRKMKFTEHQLHKSPEPKYHVPQGAYKLRAYSAMKYADEDRGMDYMVRNSMEQRNSMPERREAFGRAATMPMVRTSYSDSYRPRTDILREQEREISELRRDINQLERHPDYHHEHDRRHDDYREPGKMADRNNNINEMLHDQAKQMRHLEHEIERLKEPHLLKPAGKPTWPLIDTDMKLRAQDDMAYRRDDRPMYDNPRAQSDERFLEDFEPQTDRAGYRRHNRDNEIFGQSVQKVPEYLNVSPRRHPVGKLYNKDSTYTTDFDVPFGKHGSRNLGNPNKDPMEPFNPFGLEGGGAPMVDASGQRKTRIAGSMGVLGRELSYSARARKAHKRDLLHKLEVHC